MILREEWKCRAESRVEVSLFSHAFALHRVSALPYLVAIKADYLLMKVIKIPICHIIAKYHLKNEVSFKLGEFRIYDLHPVLHNFAALNVFQ